VSSEQQYGAIAVPENAAGKLPVIMEAKGVSPSFFPMRIPGGINLVQILGQDIGRFIIALPGYRGEEVSYKDEHWKSASPHESWSGAADDLLSFLQVVLSTTPQADASRIGVFGRSRGGTVALLAGERDPRIRCVAAWAAPADWLSLMAHSGWTMEQSVADSIRHHSSLEEGEGQYVYNFLRYALNGEEDLPAVRRRIIASSPLYFADSLPPTDVYYGLQDSIVPPRNGRELVRQNRNIIAHFYPDAGHDQDLFLAPRSTYGFLLRCLVN
jgi:dipeptidyl aminopeptidase/acylaminoacyl peptidase